MSESNSRDILSDEEVSLMKVVDWKNELRQRNLSIGGRKRELKARLKAALALQREHGAREDESENEIANDDESDGDADAENDYEDSVKEDQQKKEEYVLETPRIQNTREITPQIQNIREITPQRTVLAFRDVENTLENFSGDNNLSIEQWLKNFEGMAELCDWSDILKVAYARRLLTGSAALFEEFEDCAKSWIKMKKALLDEFGEKISSFQVHRELGQRRKKEDETYQEYVYKMMKIAAQAKVDVESIIQYIIEGIPDDAANKACLHGATTIRDLRDRLKQYENIKRETQTKNNKNGDRRDNKNNVKRAGSTGLLTKKIRCFNCGDKDHVGANCPVKEKGVKCFNEFGHIASKCSGKKNEVNVVSKQYKRKYETEVIIHGEAFIALVDTGSDLTFMRAKEYRGLGASRLSGEKVKFKVFGGAGYETLGECTMPIIVDNNEYTVTFHIIPDEVMTHPVLLGTDFFDRVDLYIKGGKVLRFQQNKDDKETLNVPDVLQIDIPNNAKEIDLSHVNETKYREEIRELITNYKPEKTHDVGIKTRIILKDDIPVASRPRRLSPSEKQEVEELMKQWLDEGIIRPSSSEYASSIVLVKKKDGSTRVCVDYRELNKKIERPRFPLPFIEDQLDQLQGAKIFTTLDLKNGFFSCSGRRGKPTLYCIRHADESV